MSQVKPIIKRDANGNCVHSRDITGYEQWREFDANGRMIHYRNSDGWEQWHEYDANGDEIYYRTSDGTEYWYWKGEITEDPIKILLLKAKLMKIKAKLMKKDVLSE